MYPASPIRSSPGQGRRWRNLTARDVNAYLHDTLGVPFSAKDFRTWGGTLRAATVLAELGPAHSESEGKRNVATATASKDSLGTCGHGRRPRSVR